MLAGMTLPMPVGTGSPSSSTPASTETIGSTTWTTAYATPK